MTTAGNIVAQGDAAGNFNIYRADNGEKLWSMFAQSGIIAAPSTFEVGGEQYLAVLSGWGGSYALSGGKAAALSGNLRNVSRLLVFKLGAARRCRRWNRAPSSSILRLHPPTRRPSRAANRYTISTAVHAMANTGRRRRGWRFAGIEFFRSGFFLQYRAGRCAERTPAWLRSVALNRENATDIRNFIIYRANQDSKSAAAPAGTSGGQ